MSEMFLATGTCFAMGIITTLHPCPFTTNIAAISLLTSWNAKPRRSTALLTFFIAGYLCAYFVLSVLIGSGIYAIPEAGRNLQRYFPIFLGPILILAGMFQAGIIRPDRHFIEQMARKLVGKRLMELHAFPLGAILAMSFCPATAAIFFGTLMPLALGHGQIVLFPLVFALGAAIPIATASILVTRGVKLAGKNRWADLLPVVTGWLLIIIGLYLCVQNIYLPLIRS